MKLEDLDTLLRNKLQFKETEVSSAERDQVFAGLGIANGNKEKPVFAWIAVVGCLLLGMIILLNIDSKNQIDTLVSNSKTEAKNNVGNSLKKEEFRKSEIEELQKPNLTNDNSNSNLPKIEAKQNAVTNKTKADIVPVGSKLINVKGLIDAENSLNKSEPKRPFSSIMVASSARKINMQVRPGLKENLAQVISNPIWQFDGSRIKESKGSEILNFIKPQLSIYSTALSSLEEQTAKEPNSDFVHKSYISEYNAGNQRNWTLNTGFDLKLNLFGFLNIGSGLGVINTGSSYDYDFLVNEIPVEDSASGFIFGYISRPDSLSQRINQAGKSTATYIEIPLQLNFRLFTYKNWQLGVEGAYTFQKLMNKKGNSLNQTTLQIDNSTNYRNKLKSYQFGLPITYNLSSRNSITIMPHWGKAIGNIAVNENINTTRKYNGLKVSFNYNLIK